jgi:GntR family transcriptional regulator
MLMNDDKSAERRTWHQPLYLQLREVMVKRIADGTWKSGDLLPNEGDLARAFGVSVGTMRKGLDLMERERLIRRRQGRGTFINDPSSHELLLRFANVCGPDGKRILGYVKWTEVEEGVANKMECTRLGLTITDRVYRTRRLRYADHKPFMLVDSSMPAALFPGLDKLNGGPAEIVTLAREFGMLLGRAEERVSIEDASARVGKALAIAAGSSVAVLDRVVYRLDGIPVHWRMGWCELTKNRYLAEMR